MCLGTAYGSFRGMKTRVSLVSSSLGTSRNSLISFGNFDAQEHISLTVMAEEHTKLSFAL